MSNTKVWLDPSDCGLTTVESAERQRRAEAERQRREEAARQRKLEEERRKEAERKREAEEKRQREEQEAMRRKEKEEEKAKMQASAQPKGEILPPAPKSPALAPLGADAIAVPDFSGLERQIRSAAGMLDLSKPEGWLDSWFYRPDHRIDVKTERGLRLAGYIAACTAIIEEARKAIEASGALQRAKDQLVINRFISLRLLAEEQYRLELARRQAERQDAIEDARTKAEIARHEADAREHSLRGRPKPPPPPPLPTPKPEDPRAKKKAALQQQLDRLAQEERAELARISGGKPQGEWTDDMHEEIKRTANMYFHAKEQVREELRSYL
jgi:hypothetical protein